MVKQRTFTRRGLVAGSVATLAVPLLAEASTDVVFDEWTDETGAIAIAWDPAVWTPNDDIESGVGAGIRLGTSTVFGVPAYSIGTGTFGDDWTSVADAKAHAMDSWFSQGMLDSVIFGEYETDDAYGWIHYADFQGNPRTVSIMQYLLLDAPNSWMNIYVSIDVQAFEDQDIDDVFDAVTINDDSVFVIGRQRTIIRAIEDAFEA